MKKTLLFLFCGQLFSSNLDMNASITANYGDSYDFYSFSENRLDLNLFYNDIQGWVQYEYSNPADLGFPMNDIRKFRIEYALDNYIIKLGDIYEFWGRGLVLNQFDDQTTNYDNGTRGLYFEYNNGPLTLNHINGNSDIWHFGADLRVPAYNNDHSMYANQIKYDWNSLSIGVNQLKSNENHQTQFGTARSDVHHSIIGAYGSYSFSNADFFVEYVDKVATEKTYLTANDTIKRGHGVYGNLNLYLGNWGLSSEYKRYAFDKAHGDLTADDYGNQIEYQQMPTLGKEQNSTLLGRVSHNYNFNDERAVQFELNGSISGITLTSQYSHISRNEDWQSITTSEWVPKPLSDYLPSSDPSSLPYWENYHEISGYALNDKIYFKLGRGENKEVVKTTRFFESDSQRHQIFDSTMVIDSVYFDVLGYSLYDTSFVYDTSRSDPYEVEAKYWQESKSFTIPMEVNMILKDGYTFGVGFQYQERKKNNIKKGNANKFKVNVGDYGENLWVYSEYDSNFQEIISMPENDISSVTTQFSEYFRADSNDIDEDNNIEIGDWISNPVNRQFNRLLYLSISRASKWSFTITQEWTNSYESAQNIDPYYNPLEALIFGDSKYFLGKRDNVDPPDFIQNKWVSAELAFYLTSSQRVSIMYGSIKGGLFCSNGICREIPAFNDGLKISYTASF